MKLTQEKQEQIYGGSAVVLVCGFVLTLKVMKGELRMESRAAADHQALSRQAFEDKRYVELRVSCRKPRGQNEYAVIKTGMNWRDVTKVLN